MGASVDFDPSTAVPVEEASSVFETPKLLERPNDQGFDPSSALPVQESVAQDARQAIADDMANKTHLDFHTLADLYKTANTQGPWGKLGSAVSAIRDASYNAQKEALLHPVQAAEDAYHFVAPAVATASRAVKDFTGIGQTPEERQAALQKSIGSNDLSVVSGLTSFAGRILPAASNLLGGVANLADPKDASNVDAVTHIINRAAEQGITDKDAIVAHLGGDPGGDIAKAAEFGGWSLLPIGAEAELAPIIAKGAEAAVEKGTELAGNAVSAGAKTIKAVAPAAAALYEGSQHGFIPMLGALVAGYSKLDAIPAWLGGGTLAKVKHALIEAPFDFVDKAGNIAAKAKDGQTVMESWADTVDTEINRKAQQLASMQKQFPEEAKQAMAPDLLSGGRVNTVADLKGASQAQKIRALEDDILGLNAKRSAIQKYQFVNQILSDTGKFGLRTAGNTAVGATTMAALSGTGAPPGQETPAAVQGFETGAALSGPGAVLHGKEGVSTMIRDRLIAGADNVISDHPFAQQHADAMASLPKTAQDEVNKFSGLAALSSSKPVLVLKPDDLKAALKSEESVDVAEAPRGYAGKDVIYANADTLASGGIPHELIHGTGLDSNPEVVQAVRDMTEAHPDKVQKAIDAYNVDLEHTSPGAIPLTLDSAPAEIIAALGADILKDIPPEALFGGRSGGQLISKWFSDKFGSRGIGSTSQYGFPVTPKLKSAFTDALFDLGKKAEQGILVRQPTTAAGIPSIVTPQVAPATSIPSVPAVALDAIQTAADALVVMGFKDKAKALEMAQAAAAEGATTPEEIFALAARKKANPIPAGGESNAIPQPKSTRQIPRVSETGQNVASDVGQVGVGNAEGQTAGANIPSVEPAGAPAALKVNELSKSIPEVSVAQPTGAGMASVVPEAASKTAIPAVTEGKPEDVAHPDYQSIIAQAEEAKRSELAGTKRKTKNSEIGRAGIEAAAQAHAEHLKATEKFHVEPDAKENQDDLVTWRTDRFGDSAIGGTRIDPKDPFHKLLIDKAGLTPGQMARLDKFSDHMGQLFGLENYSHAAKEGEATGATRKEEQKSSPAQARVDKAGETQNAPLNIVPSYIKFNLPSNRFTVHGFNPDKFFANGQKLFSYPDSGALKAYPKGVNDPKIVEDFKAARENNDNGWTGDGRKPIEGTPFTSVPLNPDFKPNIIPHDRFQVLNAMMGYAEPKGRTAKSADVQILGQQNAAYQNPETGEFNQVRAKLGPEAGLLENTSEALRPENMSGKVSVEPVADEHLLRPSGVKPEQLKALVDIKPLRSDFAQGGFLPAPAPNTPEFMRFLPSGKYARIPDVSMNPTTRIPSFATVQKRRDE